MLNIIQERGKSGCGSEFKAAKSSASKSSKHDETGAVIATCRHHIIPRAVNMFVGETYRHAHYLQHFFYKKGVTFFCYDVICQYWPWAVKLASHFHDFPDFVEMIEKMIPFLSRMHAMIHVWYCYVSYHSFSSTLK